MDRNNIKYNFDFIKKVKSYALAMVFSIGMNQFVNGFSKDILEPIVNSIVPGETNQPTKIGGIDFYLKRFLVKVLIFLILIIFTYHMLKT